MRLATVESDGVLRAAAVVGDRAHLLPAGTTVLDLVR